MNTLNKFAIALVLMASVAFGQTALSTTTLGAAVTTPNNGVAPTRITLASTSTMQNMGPQNQPNTVLYCDRELMYVVTVVSGTVVDVQRAKGGGAGGVVTNHNSGALCYFANTANTGNPGGPTPATSFFSNVQTNGENAGACSRTSNLGLPVIYVYSGDVFDCKRTGAAGTAGQWIHVGNGSMGVAGSRVSGFCTGTVGSNEVAFLNGAACSGGTTATARQVITAYGTLANLRVYSSAVVVSGGTDPVVVLKNGSDTAITCSMLAGATTCSDLLHSVQVAPGDVITFSFDSTTSDTAANISASVGLF